MKTMTAIFLTLLATTAAAQDYLEVETTVQKQEVYVNEAGEEATRMVVAERVLSALDLGAQTGETSLES